MIIVIVEAVNNALTSYIRLYNYVKVNFKRTNQSCSPSEINQSVLNGALVIEKWLHNLLEKKRKTFVV